MFGLLYTPGELYASMLNDLAISRGEEEIEKPDLTVVFHTDIAASCVPVYANQTWSFLHMILSTGPQSLVNLRTSSTYCVLSTCLSLLCILIYVLCIFKYRTSMPNRLLRCIHSLNGH